MFFFFVGLFDSGHAGRSAGGHVTILGRRSLCACEVSIIRTKLRNCY